MEQGMKNLLDLLTRTIELKGDDTQALLINPYLADTARDNGKRPAYIKFYSPDAWARNLTGDTDRVDAYIIVRVPKELLEVKEGTIEQP